MVFNLPFANKKYCRTSTIVFFLFFLMIDLYILILTVNAQIFIPNAELAILKGTPTNKVNAETET